MSVDRLFEEFVEADRSGVAEPSAYLARVSGSEREELEARLDAYLASAPRRPFDRHFPALIRCSGRSIGSTMRLTAARMVMLSS